MMNSYEKDKGINQQSMNKLFKIKRSRRNLSKNKNKGEKYNSINVIQSYLILFIL